MADDAAVTTPNAAPMVSGLLPTFSAAMATIASIVNALWELLSKSQFDEYFMYLTAVLPVLCVIWVVIRRCCRCRPEADGYADIEKNDLKKQPKNGALHAMAADMNLGADLQKMLKTTAEHVDESFVRLRAEAAADHRQQLDREMGRLNKRLDDQDRKLEQVLKLLGATESSGGGSSSSPAKASPPTLNKAAGLGGTGSPAPSAQSLPPPQSLPAPGTGAGSTSRPPQGAGHSSHARGNASARRAADGPLGASRSGATPGTPGSFKGGKTGASTHRPSGGGPSC